MTKLLTSINFNNDIYLITLFCVKYGNSKSMPDLIMGGSYMAEHGYRPRFSTEFKIIRYIFADFRKQIRELLADTEI